MQNLYVPPFFIMREQDSYKDYMTPEKMRQHALMLSNRVKKRYSHFRKRYARAKIDCFRLYDWDIPEIRAVVDWYAGHLVVGEYIRKQTGEKWLPAMAQAVSEVLDVPPSKTFIRKRQTKTQEGPRYKRIRTKEKKFIVNEGDLKFLINLNDFLDTGLFSDHRNTRLLLREMVKGKDFLNLYAYTGAFTCAAAYAKAKSTVSVDRSATYVKWAKENLKLNNLISNKHAFVQSDVDQFIKRAKADNVKFDLAFIDPPSFFQDEQRNVSFDINRDHPQMLMSLMEIMRPKSQILFSTNHQRFEPRFEKLQVKNIVELTPKTIPEDYYNKQVHRCWQISV